MIRQLDQLFGYFIAKLHDSGLEDVVDVVLTADHGHAEVVLIVLQCSEYIYSSQVIILATLQYPFMVHPYTVFLLDRRSKKCYVCARLHNERRL